MVISNEERIKEAVKESRNFPSPVIEYNFDEDVDESLFCGIEHVFNKMAPKNSAKIIYRM